MNKYLYLLFIFTLTAFAAFAVDKLDPTLLYMIPFSLSALYLLAFSEGGSCFRCMSFH